MRKLLVAVLVAWLAACSSPPAEPAPRADLDGLFNQLRGAASAGEAERIELAILHVWAASGRHDVDELMIAGVSALHAGDVDDALSLFTAITQQAPDFAEGWNLRATTHMLRDEFPEALLALEQVLRLEPRHFGALAGLGRMFMLIHQDKAALHAFERALAINPHLAEARSHAAALRQQLAGRPI